MKLYILPSPYLSLSLTAAHAVYFRQCCFLRVGGFRIFFLGSSFVCRIKMT